MLLIRNKRTVQQYNYEKENVSKIGIVLYQCL